VEFSGTWLSLTVYLLLSLRLLREVRGGTATGQLTLKGITKPVQFPVALERLPDNRLRVKGVATVGRTQFGVNYNSSSFFQKLGSYAIRNDLQLTVNIVAKSKTGSKGL